MDGQVISGISGTLSRIFDRKSGTHEHGEWSIQNGELVDDAGDAIKIQFKDRPEVPESMKGSYIAIASNTTDKGTHGVKVYDDEYPQGTVTRKLRVTRSASCAAVANPSDPPQTMHDEPFQEPVVDPEPEYYPDMHEAPEPVSEPVKSQEIHTAPDGVAVTGITYREVRQKHEYEPVTVELHMSIEPNTKLSSAWKYAEQAADAMLKHSTGR